MASPSPSPLPARVHAIDAVRGAVMIVMALDHVRDFLGDAHGGATDLSVTTLPLFLTRWITHFCAPAFFLLAGASAYLSIQSGRRTAREAARFLLVRGLLLVVVEQTALRCLGWYFHFDYHFMNAGVLYGLGWSMVLLAAFLRLPPLAALVTGVAIILLEGPLSTLPLGTGPLSTLLALATRSQDFEPIADYHFFVSYPPLPWFGAMAFGYGLMSLVSPPSSPAGGAWSSHHARRRLLAFGLAFLAVFVLLRALQLGDPSPWSLQPSRLFTALSFVNLSKYPPSTDFLLLTLGVALLALAALWHRPLPVLERLGRVPLFFYLLHIPLIHLVAVAYSLLAFGAASWLTSGPVIFWDVALPGSPPTYGLSLPLVYLTWLAILAALYPLCLWYGRRKR